MSQDTYSIDADPFVMVPVGIITSSLNDRAVRTYLALRTFVRPGHATFPSLATVARLIGVSEKYVQRGVNDLRDAGFLVVTRQVRSDGRLGLNHYHFPRIPDVSVDDSTTGQICPEPADKSVQNQRTHLSGQEVNEGEVEEGEVERPGSVDPGPSDALPVSGSRMKDPETGEPATDEKRLEVFSALAGELARLVSANAEREIRPTAAWVREIRLLVEKDGRDPREVWHVLTWTQQDEFWKGNILSAGKLRAQYDRLRIQWKSGRGRTATERNLDLVARLEAEEAAGAPERSLMDVLDGMVSDGRKELGR